ncbi:MAG TPA: VOC family protein [Candidatus Angelobacter sp.]|nr:VOC family protein [Candidatus Angelobacter sp.]
MANIDKHPPGSFCWLELATTDQKSAKSFYSLLFGWSSNEFPIGEGEMYTIFQLKGRDAAAGYTMRKEQRTQGIPSHWMLYISAASADQTQEKARQAGGTILQPAFDVAQNGRMAVLKDATGAIFSVWQPNQTQGIAIANEDNSFCWADLNTSAADRASKFYSSVFGWKFEKSQHDSSGYLHIKNGEQFIGGIPPLEPGEAHLPPHWLAYFMVADAEATQKKAADLGAKILMPAHKMEGVGTWAIVADPQGAVFAVFKPGR